MTDFDPIDYDAAVLTLRPIRFSTGPNFWTVDIGCGSLNAPTIRELLAGLRGVIAAENEYFSPSTQAVS